MKKILDELLDSKLSDKEIQSKNKETMTIIKTALTLPHMNNGQIDNSKTDKIIIIKKYFIQNPELKPLINEYQILHHIVEFSTANVINLLLDLEADINLKNKTGKTPLDLVISKYFTIGDDNITSITNNDIDAIEILINNGALFDIADFDNLYKKSLVNEELDQLIFKTAIIQSLFKENGAAEVLKRFTKNHDIKYYLNEDYDFFKEQFEFHYSNIIGDLFKEKTKASQIIKINKVIKNNMTELGLDKINFTVDNSEQQIVLSEYMSQNFSEIYPVPTLQLIVENFITQAYKDEKITESAIKNKLSLEMQEYVLEKKVLVEQDNQNNQINSTQSNAVTNTNNEYGLSNLQEENLSGESGTSSQNSKKCKHKDDASNTKENSGEKRKDASQNSEEHEDDSSSRANEIWDSTKNNSSLNFVESNHSVSAEREKNVSKQNNSSSQNSKKRKYSDTFSEKETGNVNESDAFFEEEETGNVSENDSLNTHSLFDNQEEELLLNAPFKPHVPPRPYTRAMDQEQQEM